MARPTAPRAAPRVAPRQARRQAPSGDASPPWVAGAVGTGHDLRQSLQAATLQAHALVLQAQQQGQPAWAQMGGQMAQALQHCQQLLERLLTDLRLAATPLALAAAAPAPDWQTVDLGRLLDALVMAWQPVAAQRSLRLDLLRPEPAPQLRSDALLLRRVLDNLVSNALAHTANGGVTLRLLPAAGPGQPGPVITISDTGAGLPAEAPGQTASAPGHGLGLMIVRSLCAQLGIAVDLQSQAGAGTVARLAWPAAATIDADVQPLGG